MSGGIRVIHYGLGAIGSQIARLVLSREGMRSVAAIDIDEGKAGRDLGRVIGLDRPLDIPVSKTLASALEGREAEVVLHSTDSFLEKVIPQLREVISAGLNIVSTCEELAYPAAQHPKLAVEIDTLAKERGVTVLGTGVNPGFIMDTLPLVITGVCQEVHRIHVWRRVDAGRRRLSLQRKAGAGLTRAQFQEGVKARRVGHIGLRESVALIAGALGWELEAIEESLEPVIAERPMRTQFLEVGAGQVAGVHQIGRGIKDGQEVITLDLEICVGLEGARDTISVEGRPSIKLTMEGVHGDIATAAMVVNAIPRVVDAPPGLVTMADLPLVQAGLDRSPLNL